LKADYKERVFLAATGRRDYASTLPTANRALIIFLLAFVFHDLIDKEGSLLFFGKLRGSWAQVGKIPPFGIGRYNYQILSLMVCRCGVSLEFTVDADRY
jgi:hypothetical protein